jgi:hypothetical protein
MGHAPPGTLSSPLVFTNVTLIIHTKSSIRFRFLKKVIHKFLAGCEFLKARFIQLRHGETWPYIQIWTNVDNR